MIAPSQGSLLIADPFLKDSNFMRSVILMCRHSAEGSFGFVLNKLYDLTIGDLIDDMEGCALPVFTGGPVQMDTVHYIHQYPDLLPGSQLIANDIYWGGDFDLLKKLVKEKTIDTAKLKFFIGYSGWETGQLDNEMEQKSWVTVTSTRKLVFNTPLNEIWKASLRYLGGNYEMMINYPIDPQLN
ncbi:MAG: YqgE/AlgH family protein [Ferruginibacter sp.]